MGVGDREHDRKRGVSGTEVELKPMGAIGGRPMSWGERVDRREQRERAGKFALGIRLVGRALARMGRFARSIGMTRRRIVVDGVVYRERSSVSLRRSLSATGSGVKEYDVRFPVRGGAIKSSQYPMRETMRIRYTHKRMYGDLGHDPRVYFMGLIGDRIKPGDRVLEIGCGTGSASAIIAGLVGPSGAVVSMHRDGESIRYARQRHRHNHLAFELGWIETLDGELDGAFDAVVVVDLFRDAPDDPSKSRAAGEIWRMVRPGGLVVVMAQNRHRLDQKTDRFLAMGIESLEILEPDPVLLWGGAVGVRGQASGGGKGTGSGGNQ